MSICHAGTRLGNNRARLLVGTGVWGNLSGDAWVQEQALLSKKAGYVPSQAKLDTPLDVQGVVSGPQQCNWKSQLPIALTRGDGAASLETYTAPIAPNSQIPGLFGFQSMMAKRA
eukprot:7234229-Lingulodinium_polyedra.AAC.1